MFEVAGGEMLGVKSKFNRFIWIIFLFPWTADLQAKTDAQSKLRSAKIDSIIIHAVGGPYCKQGKLVYSYAQGNAGFWKRFFEAQPVVGIHYIVDREGVVVSSISESKVANHALGWNARSIGVELVNAGDGLDKYSSSQILSLVLLVKDIRSRNSLIIDANVVRHSDLDKRVFSCAGVKVKRKQDPGVLFDFKVFKQAIK